MISKIKGALFGLAVGDALGVPVEFKSREALQLDPVVGMRGYGSWNQPPGTWSDDSSLAFCLAENLTEEYNIHTLANSFIKWMEHGYWGAHHELFDIGGATKYALQRIQNGTSPMFSGGMMPHDNGNGSLMRIMPLVFYVKNLPNNKVYEMVKEVSSITHAHFRSVLSCYIYVQLALFVLEGNDIATSYKKMQETVNAFIEQQQFGKEEVALFDNILKINIASKAEDDIHSTGYVLHTLEASLWCLLTTTNYADAVLKAVNLGGDTDTTACVTGGLAGLYYGYDGIPNEWVNQIARKDDIMELCTKLNKKYEI
jgi:ADP-ribosyl-[dinitrogen reductase] hydrolase